MDQKRLKLFFIRKTYFSTKIFEKTFKKDKPIQELKRIYF